MTRFARFWVGLSALTILLSLPGGASAGWLLGRHVDSGSYSPLHYWLPSLYTFRAYHRQGNFYDQAQYDLPDAVPADNCPIASPDATSPKKEVGKN